MDLTKKSHTITLAMAKTLKFKQVSVIPGQWFCRNCFCKAQGLKLDDQSASIGSHSLNSEIKLDLQHKINNHDQQRKLGVSTEVIEISPITTRNIHSKPKATKAKQKLTKVVTNLKDAVFTYSLKFTYSIAI